MVQLLQRAATELQYAREQMGIRTNGTITEKRAAIYSRTNGNSNKWNAEVSIWLRKNKMEPVPRKTKQNRSPGKLARHSPYAIFDSP